MTGPLTIKIGGSAGTHEAALRRLVAEADASAVFVHGGGNEIGDWSRRLGMEPIFNDGRRVTDAATLEIAVAVLAGLVNTRLVAQLGAWGRGAVGVTGVDGALARVTPADPAWGAVGDMQSADAGILASLLVSGLTPVVAPIAALADGTLVNVNADEMAGAIAAARGGTLLLLTDVDGVQRDGTTLPKLTDAEAEGMLAGGGASAGMRPKLRAALVAARAGCAVRIVDGRDAETVSAALRGEPSGTEILATAEART